MQYPQHGTGQPYDYDSPHYPPVPDALPPAPSVALSPSAPPKQNSGITLLPPTRRQKIVRRVFAFWFIFLLVLKLVSSLAIIPDEQPDNPREQFWSDNLNRDATDDFYPAPKRPLQSGALPSHKRHHA